MSKRPTKTKLGTAGASLLHRRTGAEALATATATAPRMTRAARLTLVGGKITTIRFQSDQWAWIRRQALERAIVSGTQTDASSIVRELVAEAMAKAKGAAR